MYIVIVGFYFALFSLICGALCFSLSGYVL